MTFEHIRKMLVAPELSDIRWCFTGILEHAAGSLGGEQEGVLGLPSGRHCQQSLFVYVAQVRTTVERRENVQLRL